MAHDAAAVVLERFEVAPPRGSVPSTNLPLTFFDVPWLYIPPMQRIFFFKFPHPTQHFLQSALPPLKNSLPLILQHFFPFASNLILPPQLHIAAPYIRYLDGEDSLPFTVAESSPSSNFDHLVSDSPQDVSNWHPFVPTFPSPRTEEDGTRIVPIMAVQVTVLPNSGFSICLAFHHVAADGRSLHHFVKYWASVCRKTGDLASTMSLPFHDRDMVKDPKGLKLIYLQEIQEFAGLKRDVSTSKVRATLVLRHGRVEKLKKWIRTEPMSTFVATCSLFWVCMIKSEQRSKGNCNDELCYLMFPADCRDSPQISLPSTYFGNCLATCIVAVEKGELVGGNGIVEAANGIEREIRNWRSDALHKAETTMLDLRGLAKKPGKSVLVVAVVAGSPKLAVYETDFGWGKPEKSEAVHLASGSISLSNCRDSAQGGIEVGLVLERIRMNNFIKIFEQQFINM